MNDELSGSSFIIHNLATRIREDAVSFAKSLEKIMDRIEGSAAAAILGVDGILIERLVRDLDPALDAELVAIEFTNLLRRAVVTASDTELGELTEMIVATDLVTFLLRPITAEYFLLLALNPGGNVGRARFELRRTQLDLKEEFTI